MTFWEQLIYFFSFTDANITNVLIGTLLLGTAAGMVGTLVVLSKKTLIIDAISHSMLPGICIGFLLSGVKNPLYLMGGGMASATLAVYLIGEISKRSKIKMDAAIAITLSILFSFGVIMLNVVQNTGNPNQSGLNDFLFGKAASMLREDLYLFGGLSLIAFICLPLFFRHFKISLFDPIFAQSIGIKRFMIQSVISFLIIITAAAGVQTVGIILISAMIIAPASASLLWTNDFKKTLIYAGIIGATCSIIGVFISYLSPKMPTGPWIVVTLASVSILSVLFSPNGLLVKQLQIRKNRKNILRENVLKTVYKLKEKIKRSSQGVSTEQVSNYRPTAIRKVRRALKYLKRKGLIIKGGDFWSLTEKGMKEAERIVRIHRLWELYLQKYMHLPSNYVHDSAESIEHIVTPEIERSLEQIMGKPELDPHQQKIPYRK
ncbi:MAG: manganese/zinc/iron transport system permease protein [Saprospiraceae bacterium]|jgi:manganese/zinc/iron transport system permease protein